MDEWLRIPGSTGAFAIGDTGSPRVGDRELPMLSPPAMQAGRYVASTIVDEVRGVQTERQPFRYLDKGTMATVGRNAGVTHLPGGLEFTGILGWLTWLFVHIYYLIGFRNRVAVLASWGWNYFLRDRPIRLITQSEPDPLVEELDPPPR